MKMVAHKAIGVDLPFGLLAGLTQRGEKALSILIVPENQLALIAPVHHMIHRTGVLDPHLPWHQAQLTMCLLLVNSEDRPLSGQTS